jgi:hypothetical protein
MRINILTLSIAFLLLFSLAACNLERKENFGIYLEDTGELMLWEKHIKAYHPDENTFELNADGIKRWNSYQNYKDIPKLDDSLFRRRFIKISAEYPSACWRDESGLVRNLVG